MKPDELWEKYQSYRTAESAMSKMVFISALNEYGEAVRKQAVSVCNTLEASGTTRRSGRFIASAVDCAAAIEKMELP